MSLARTSPPGRSRPRRSDVRAQVLGAAATAFRERPYGEVSVTAIARNAGFTKGAVYSNFGGKPQLFAAVLAEQFTTYVGTTVTEALAAADADGAQDATRAVAASLTRALAGGHRLPALLAEFRSLAVGDPELAAAYAGLRLQQRLELEEVLAGPVVRLRLAPGVDLAVAATLLLTCMNSLALEHAAAPSTVPEPLVEAVLSQVLAGILA